VLNGPCYERHLAPVPPTVDGARTAEDALAHVGR
jgi:hypothetical protein